MPTYRKVKQFDLENNLIAVFETTQEASLKTGTNQGSIVGCCRNKRKTANGFKWKYDNTDYVIKTSPLDKLLDFL